MHHSALRTATPSHHDTPTDPLIGSDEITGWSPSGSQAEESGLPRTLVGIRRRTLHRATAVGILAFAFAVTGQSVAQAAPAPAPAPAAAPADSSTGAYAHPCPACSLTQGFTAGVHNGLDLAAPIGTPIYAAAAGSVTAAGPRDPAGFGQVVYINNDDGTVAWYGHIDTWLVNVGNHVVAGQQIATVGNRGDATGPHLHFEIHAPDPVDPAAWLRAHGVNI
jgi:murein DD-endopeptidase MepM/ murein hydrolase activator NlpD